MRIKIIAIVLTLCFMATNTENVLAIENATNGINVKAAIEMSINSSQALKLFDDKIKYASQRYQQASTESVSPKRKYWENDVQLIENKKAEILYPLQRKNEVNQLVWEKQNKIDMIKIDVTKAYHQIINKEATIVLKQSAIKRLRNELKMKKQQVTKGVDIQSAIISLEISINQESQKLEKLKRDRDIQIMKLSVLIGIDIGTRIVLENEQLPKKDLDKFDIVKLIEDQLIKNHRIEKANLDLEEAKTEADIIKRYSDEIGTNGIENVEDRIRELEYKLKDSKYELKVSILNDYNSLLNLKADIEINKLEHDKCKKSSEIAKEKQKLGLLTAVDYEKIRANEDEAMISWEQSKVEYFVACENFKEYII